VAEFSAEVFQNEFLSDGATDVHAVVSVTCTGAGAGSGAGVSAGGPGGVAEIVAVDTSGSMQGRNMEAAKHAAAVAVDQIPDGTLFAIIGGSHVATRIFPYPNARVPMVAMEPGARNEAKRAISTMSASGGTAISSWLRLADDLFATVPAAQKHLILLTDGKNESEPTMHLDRMIADVTGHFQCDARGVGDRWVVEELRKISTALLGTVDLIARPEDIAEDFSALVRKSMAPQGSEVLFVKQVAPEVDDLTGRRTQVNALTSAYATGAWADETREYHVAVRVPAKPVGSEQLAARVQVAVGDEVAASGLVKAKWSDDSTLTARISPEVAHYTGQAELASAIQEGLAAKAAGDEATATVKLGRAVQLAAETGNDDATSRLRKIVEVDNEEAGTVRLKRNTAKLDEMALDTASTKTTRVRRA
jgi:hypothetical protein